MIPPSLFYTITSLRLPTVLSKLEEYNSEQSDYIHYLMERKCEFMRAKEFLVRVQAAVELKHDLFYQTLSTLVISSFLKSFDDHVCISFNDTFIHIAITTLNS